MARCADCGKKIDDGDYCERCQSKTLFGDSGTALPDCFDWEVPQPDWNGKSAPVKDRRK